MPGAARVLVDNAGGVIAGPGIPSVKINGATACVKGDAVFTHGSGAHGNAHFSFLFSATVFIGGLNAVRAGDLATCFHAAFPGSSDVLIGG